MRGNPSNLEDRGNLVQAHLSLGEILATSGNRPEAIKHYDEATHIQEASMAMGTPDPAALRKAANLWASMGSLRLLSSDPGGALECYRRGLQTVERLPASYANKATLLAYMRENVASTTVSAGRDATGAEEMILESIATYQHRVDANPIPRARRLLAQAYEVRAPRIAATLTINLPKFTLYFRCCAELFIFTLTYERRRTRRKSLIHFPSQTPKEPIILVALSIPATHNKRLLIANSDCEWCPSKCSVEPRL